MGQRIALYPEMYRPKLFSKPPSMKAIDTYNSIETDNFHTYDNLSFTPDGSEIAVDYKPPLTPASLTNSYDYATTLSANSSHSIYMQTFDNNRGGIIYTNSDGTYDYPTLRSTTSIGDNQSEAESRREDQGSTSRLVSSKSPAVRFFLFFNSTLLCFNDLFLLRIHLLTSFSDIFNFYNKYVSYSVYPCVPLLNSFQISSFH